MRSNKPSNRFSGFLVIAKWFLILLISFPANAQCAMCRAALEGDSNTAQAEAVNDGIVYLMIVPYLLVGVIGFAVYKMYSKKNL